MLAHMRRALLPLAIVLAIVTVAVPTYSMVGCKMDMGAMRFVPMRGFHFTAPCPGSWVLSTGPVGTVPVTSSPLLLTFMAALAAVFVLIAPQFMVSPVVVRAKNPPPPREEPRGQRYRV